MALGNLLRYLVGDNIKILDSKLCQTEFAHKHASNRSLGFNLSSSLWRGSAFFIGFSYLALQDALSWTCHFTKWVISSWWTTKRKRMWSFPPQSIRLWLTWNTAAWSISRVTWFGSSFQRMVCHLMSTSSWSRVRLIRLTWLSTSMPYLRTHNVFNVKHLHPFFGDNVKPDLWANPLPPGRT